MIGRSKEAKELMNLYESENAELVVIYGRRRVGKTYLVNELFKEELAFSHAGLSPLEHESRSLLKDQLSRFYLSLLSFGMQEGKKPKS